MTVTNQGGEISMTVETQRFIMAKKTAINISIGILIYHERNSVLQ
jgi:hypothetical protein